MIDLSVFLLAFLTTRSGKSRAGGGFQLLYIESLPDNPYKT